jgi:Holliday junction resolvase-like predicted endonuclease
MELPAELTTGALVRYAAKVDAEHASVRDTLREMGLRVIDTSRYPGFVDLMVKRRGRKYWEFIEVKTAQNKAGRIEKTDSQRKLEAQGVEIIYLRTREEAMTWAKETR